jgi:hypothetical protein
LSVNTALRVAAETLVYANHIAYLPAEQKKFINVGLLIKQQARLDGPSLPESNGSSLQIIVTELVSVAVANKNRILEVFGLNLCSDIFYPN